MPSQTSPASTHMLNEIREQPEALRRALAGAREQATRIAEEFKRRDLDLILFAARGTSDHAALYAQYVIQYLTGIPVGLATPSIFTVYGGSLRLDRALVIGISQSGQAPDVITTVTRAREAGALTASVTNAADSPLAAAVDVSMLCEAGPELSVAATKTYTTTCAVLATLAAVLPGGEGLDEALPTLPDMVAAALGTHQAISQGATRYVHASECVVLGRGFQYSTAREAALKLTETCYLLSLPFSTADFRHGPAALVESGLPVLLFASPGATAQDSGELLDWLRERGADCIVVSEDAQLLDRATTPIELQLPTDGRGNGHARVDDRATAHELLSPIAYIAAGQLFAHDLALARRLNPDKPRGLTKVTRTE